MEIHYFRLHSWYNTNIVSDKECLETEMGDNILVYKNLFNIFFNYITYFQVEALEDEFGIDRFFKTTSNLRWCMIIDHMNF